MDLHMFTLEFQKKRVTKKKTVESLRKPNGSDNLERKKGRVARLIESTTVSVAYQSLDSLRE